MRPFQPLSAVDQLTKHLRQQILMGELSGNMPGTNALAKALECSPRTVIASIEQLEREGFLLKQGVGRKSLIQLPDSAEEQKSLRIAILLLIPEDIGLSYMGALEDELEKQGHSVNFIGKSLSEMKHDLSKIKRLVATTEADAWIIEGGTGEVIQWFASQHRPAFALFGHQSDFDIAGIGPDKHESMRHMARHLLKIGHTRISCFVRSQWLPLPPTSPIRPFMDELEAAGVVTGTYNLPEWDGSIEGLHQQLDSLFQITPPTALVIDEPPIFLSALHHLARKGVLAPEHVSLICTDRDPYFKLLRPSIAHIDWDSRPWVRRMVQWVRNIAEGKVDKRQSRTNTNFVQGGSIGPPKQASSLPNLKTNSFS